MKKKNISAGKRCNMTEGTVLSEFSDLKSDLGLIYYRGGYEFEYEDIFDRPALVFARCHSVLDISAGGRQLGLAEAGTVTLVPAGTSFKMKAVTALSHAAVLCPSAELLSKTALLYGLTGKSVEKVFSRSAVFKRTNWLNEIMHRYVFERVEARNNNNAATKFLETEVIKEIYFLLKADEPVRNVFNLDETNVYNNQPVLKRALDYIETHLFEDITMPLLEKHTYASEATLLRAFNSEFKKTPFAYIADRRLDESLMLLRGGKYSVSEIADVVGYKTASGFIAAFRARFKCTPLKWRARNSGQTAE